MLILFLGYCEQCCHECRNVCVRSFQHTDLISFEYTCFETMKSWDNA